MFESPQKALSLTRIEALAQKLAARIHAPPAYIPTFNGSDGTGRPNIEVHGAVYHWIVSERGSEYERRITTDLDKLLYWVFASVTFQMATDHELKHREPEHDFRRLLFSYQLELLRGLNPAWEQERRQELEVVLGKAPFDDGLPSAV